MNRTRAWLEYLPIAAGARLLRLVPRRAALAAGRGLGRLAWMVDTTHRRIALENLTAAFGDSMSPDDRRRLTGRIFAHFGMVAVDCLLMRSLHPGDVDRLIEYEGVDHLRKAFLKGKGVFVFSAHLGNWEMVALMQGWLGYPMAMVTRPLDNPLLDRLLLEGRTRSGNLVIHKRSAVRGILKAIRNGWCVAIVIDQDIRGTEHVFVDFFGRPAATTPTLGLLALKTGSPVVPAFGLPLEDGRYRVTYLPEVPVSEIACTGSREGDVAAITQACTRIIEQQVRARPECWLWMHKRWKTTLRKRKAEPRSSNDETGVMGAKDGHPGNHVNHGNDNAGTEERS
jgi:KDO2-lipid IV(A) lauroyltransferase